MRLIFAALLLFALAACGQDAATTTSGQTGAATTQPAEGREAMSLSTRRHMPDWLFILRNKEGGTIHYNQRTITQSGGLADIWLQSRYPYQQLYQSVSGNRETVIRYELERLHYRFNCAESAYMIVERQFMGANEQIVARDEPRQLWRPVVQGGAAFRAMPIACARRR